MASAAALGVTATAISHRVVVGGGGSTGQHPATMQLGVGASRSSLRSSQAPPPSLTPHTSHLASPHPEPTPIPYHTHTPTAAATAAAAAVAAATAAWPYSSHPGGHPSTAGIHPQAYSMPMWSPSATAAANLPFQQSSYHPSVYTHHHMPSARASYPTPPSAPAPMSSSTAAPAGFQAFGSVSSGWAGGMAAGTVGTCAHCNTRCAGCVSAALRQFLTGYSSWHQSYTRWQQQYESWAALQQGGSRTHEQQGYDAWVRQQQDHEAVARRQQEYQVWQQQQQPQQQSYEDAWGAYR